MTLAVICDVSWARISGAIALAVAVEFVKAEFTASFMGLVAREYLLESDV
jgi:hypothetical protein